MGGKITIEILSPKFLEEAEKFAAQKFIGKKFAYCAESLRRSLKTTNITFCRRRTFQKNSATFQRY